MGRWPERTEEERFWEKVNKQGPLIVSRPELGPCYLWTAAVSRDGYARFGAWVDGKWRAMEAHRWLWNKTYGDIEEGFERDHLCHSLDVHCKGGLCIHRRCVNLMHIEIVTKIENGARGRAGWYLAARTHCPLGHEYTPENTYVAPDGSRDCRMCARAKDMRRRHGYPIVEPGSFTMSLLEEA